MAGVIPPPVASSERAAEKAFVGSVARLYGISPETLWGVYGTESGFGTNLGPSSAGAIGPFQFLPSTARLYNVNPNDFRSSARGAAHYLHDLGADGDPDSDRTAAALNSYSGGGGAAYVASVRDKGKDYGGTNLIPSPGDVIKAVTDPITAPARAAASAVELGSKVFGAITNPSTYFRLGKGVVGYTLVSLGVAGLVFIVANRAANSPAVKTAASVAGKVPK